MSSAKVRANDFGIRAVWGGRPETAEGLSGRLINMLDNMKEANPVFDDWVWVRRIGKKLEFCETEEEALASLQEIPFASIKDSLPAEIEAKISRSDYDEPEPTSGFRFYVYNSPTTPSRRVSIHVHAGSHFCWGVLLNDVWLSTNDDADADVAIIAYPSFKNAVLAIAEAFDARWGTAYSRDIGKFWPLSGPLYRFGWISYVGPCFAPLINPPPTAIVERRPNGGLLMAATDETFSIYNPAHVAAARDILAAVEPLNALPWPPELKDLEIARSWLGHTER
jgi:hypothetical protein